MEKKQPKTYETSEEIRQKKRDYYQKNRENILLKAKNRRLYQKTQNPIYKPREKHVCLYAGAIQCNNTCYNDFCNTHYYNNIKARKPTENDAKGPEILVVDA